MKIISSSNGARVGMFLHLTEERFLFRLVNLAFFLVS
jgi:hypothetical protein